MLAEGSQAPDFATVSHTGETVKLGDFAGRYVVLWFYPQAGTPGCAIQSKGFRDRIGNFDAANAVVLGVSFDTEESNRGFAEDHDLPFMLLCDTNRDLGIKYGAAAGKDAEHAQRIAYLIGPDRKILKSYREVSPESYPGQVLADLTALE